MTSISATVAAVLVVVAGAALVPIRLIAGDPNSPDGVFSSVALAAPFVAAGLVALIGEWRRKPIYSVAAGVALLPMSIVSFILIPLLIPAMVLIAVSVPRASRSSNLDIGVSVVIVVGLVAAFVALLVHEDPVSWQTPTGGGSSSDIITTAEARLSLAIVGLVLAIVAVFRRPPQPTG